MQTPTTSLPRPSRIGTGLAVLLAVGLGQAVATSSASAAASCPPRKGTLAKVSDARVWHQGTSLYACTTSYGVKPKARRIGPWTPKTRVAFDGTNVAWTTQVKRGGKTVDRVWASDVLRDGRWLGGRQALPKAAPGGSRGEARVLRIRIEGGVAGWMTDGGTVVMAARSADDTPERIGGGTLAGPVDDDYVRIEQVARTAASDLAPTLKLASGSGEGDECGGSAPYELTVSSGPNLTPRGARWYAGYLGAPACYS